MKRITQLMMVGLLALTLSITSCGKNDGPGGIGTQGCINAAQEWSDAITNFYANLDSESACEEWKDAFENLLNKCSRDYFGSTEDYQDALDELESFDCSDL